mmetsp:Transcript_9508/g.21124  ORF Transcript_9508/g.21124 Transcript_9508/m.21124 type:complete len:204 (+) Transcript_9508:506-1117(+)
MSLGPQDALQLAGEDTWALPLDLLAQELDPCAGLLPDLLHHEALLADDDPGCLSPDEEDRIRLDGAVLPLAAMRIDKPSMEEFLHDHALVVITAEDHAVVANAFPGLEDLHLTAQGCGDLLHLSTVFPENNGSEALWNANVDLHHVRVRAGRIHLRQTRCGQTIGTGGTLCLSHHGRGSGHWRRAAGRLLQAGLLPASGRLPS